MATAKLTPQQRHAAELVAAGDDQATVASKVGVNPSTVSRWAARDDFAKLVDRAKAKKAGKAKTTPSTSMPMSARNVDLSEVARQTLLTARVELETRRKAGENVARELTQVATALARMADTDRGAGVSAENIAASLQRDQKLVVGLADALDPGAAQRLVEALSEKLEAALGLDDERVRWAFMHTGTVLPFGTADVLHRLWNPVTALLRSDAAKLKALHAHRDICVQHGDEPDLASIDAVHPVDPSALIEAARVELDRITPETQKDTTNAVA